MTSEQLEVRLVRFVNEKLVTGEALPPVQPDTALFEEGYVNSLRVLDLIAFVERAIGRKIADREVKLANFRTIRVMAGTFGGTPAAANAATAPPFVRRTDRSRFASPIDALCARGDVLVLGEGRIALSGAALVLLESLDALVRQWALDLGAREYRYPDLIALDTLRRAGHLEAFPHQLTVAAPLTEDKEKLARVAANPASLAGSDLAEPSHALAPAVCYHCYPQWASQTLGPESVVVTARGQCARHEAGAFTPLERLWEFTMREIVIAGTREAVAAFRMAMMERAGALVTRFDLDGVIEAAEDPFFTSASDGQRLAQRAGALKYELRLSLDGATHTVAVASFNDHRDHFGQRFDIRLPDGSPAHTGCAAFGLERWVLGLFTQHGVDAARWPAELRALGANDRHA